ncbi:alpha/beta hydrolase family protein [Silanimonas sp.]|jgi:dienelactone hydrolase|uniref:alpha/beta hydrolase family protein n=1 Tax=Silanimonas sp. TaxID=1929290 RepID=UPI0037CC1961
MRSAVLSSLAFAAMAAAGGSAARDPIPVDAFAKMPEIQSLSMSSDGKRIVALIGKADAEEFETSLATWDLDNLGAGPTVTASGDRMKFISASALKSDHIFVVGRQEFTGAIGECGGEGQSIGNTKTFVTKAYLTDSTQSSFDEAFADKGRAMGVSDLQQRCFEIFGSAGLVNQLPLDPENVLVQQTNMGTLRTDYYRFNLRTQATELVYRAGGRATPGLFDPRTGDLLTKNELEAVGSTFEQRVLIKNPETGEFEVHDNLTRKINDRFEFNFVGRDEATGKFYVLTDLFSDLVQARMYDPKTREFDDEPLIAHPEFSIANIVLGTRPSDFNKVLGYTVAAMNIETTWVEPGLAAIHEGLKQAFPGQQVNVLSYTDDRKKFLFSTESNRHPPRYFLLVDGKQVLPLGTERTGIDPNDIGEQRWVTWTARDGMKIPGILDLPAGWTPEQGPLPTIIHPHGGPWSRDVGGWDASGWVPFLTSRGYAVLRPQYRGSSGLGRRLWLSGDAEWGQKMQDDKDDGAAWLVEQGIADADRIAIFGYSYGGFAAAAAVVRENSPYACAISGAPVTDLARLGNTWSENRLQRIVQGTTVKGMDPMQNTDKANIPVLLYVGDRDVRTPAWHAQNFYNAVKDKVPAKFELIADQPHSLPWYPRQVDQGLTLIENFLNNECKMATSNRAPAASTSTGH